MNLSSGAFAARRSGGRVAVLNCAQKNGGEPPGLCALQKKKKNSVVAW